MYFLPFSIFFPRTLHWARFFFSPPAIFGSASPRCRSPSWKAVARPGGSLSWNSRWARSPMGFRLCSANQTGFLGSFSSLQLYNITSSNHVITKNLTSNPLLAAIQGRYMSIRQFTSSFPPVLPLNRLKEGTSFACFVYILGSSTPPVRLWLLAGSESDFSLMDGPQPGTRSDIPHPRQRRSASGLSLGSVEITKQKCIFVYLSCF